MIKTSIIILICLCVLYIASVLVYASATKYHPISNNQLEKLNARPPFMVQDSSFSILTWNIGYGGLGKENDFFYDGGKDVRSSKDLVSKNMNGISSLLKDLNNDFICLQEVDICSKRSYKINQMESLHEALPNYESIFGKNYDVNFVPLPIFNPLGKVTSGIATFSNLPGTYTERIGFTSESAFPNSLFMLRRCFIKTHIPLSIGKDLVIINTHNSAYDSTGNMKKEELDILMPYLYQLYEEGHYVVAAGDWNQCTPNYQAKGRELEFRETKFPDNFLEKGWNWVSDPSTPTNRKLNTPYDPTSSYTSVLDFFLISPNLSHINVKTIDTSFDFSDHQPVVMEFKLD